jgi:hypothetical protein
MRKKRRPKQAIPIILPPRPTPMAIPRLVLSLLPPSDEELGDVTSGVAGVNDPVVFVLDPVVVDVVLLEVVVVVRLVVDVVLVETNASVATVLTENTAVVFVQQLDEPQQYWPLLQV